MDLHKLEDLEFIANQTRVTDMMEIERVYLQHDKDVSASIVYLLGGATSSRITKPRTIFDDIRDIFDEKEQLYRDHMSKQQQLQQQQAQ